MKRALGIWLAVTAAITMWAQPQVTWLDAEHDFGVFHEEVGRMSCVMHMVNSGDAPLVVNRVRASCGCTAVDYPRDVIAPGDTAAVTITYRATGRPGPFEKDVFVYTNAQPARSMITIRGQVIGAESTLSEQYPVRLGGARLTSNMLPLGEIARGSHRTAHVAGMNTSLDTLVLRVIDAPDHINAAPVPDTVAPAGVFVLSVGYEAGDGTLWGFNQDAVTVESEPLHPGDETIAGMARIEVMAQVQEDFSKMDEKALARAPRATINAGDRVNYGTVTTGETATRAFTIVNDGHSPLHIRRLWSPERAIAASSDRDVIKSGKRATVTVTLHAAALTEPVLNTTLTVITDDPTHPSQQLRVVAEVKK